jgi:hypothetical protein
MTVLAECALVDLSMTRRPNTSGHQQENLEKYSHCKQRSVAREPPCGRRTFIPNEKVELRFFLSTS